jgi:hypothetical protein
MESLTEQGKLRSITVFPRPAKYQKKQDSRYLHFVGHRLE